MERRSGLLDRFFGRAKAPAEGFTQLQMLNGSAASFTPFSGNMYDNDTVRAALDAIARNGAKLKATHIRRVDGKIAHPAESINRLLQVQPNPLISAYSFYYKVITQRFQKNNAYIFIDRGPTGQINGLYPVVANSVDFLEARGEVFCRFTFISGKVTILPYADIIHLRRFFSTHDLVGDGSGGFVNKLDLLNTIDQGIANAITTTANFHGILKFVNMLKPEDMKRYKNEFVADYLSVNNTGGVAALDSKASYEPLVHEPKVVDEKVLAHFKQSIYDYFGVSQGIVESKYTEDDWNAFYEGTLEPMALEMSNEFTSKIFSGRSQGFGNEIMFESNRLQYASNSTKIKLIKESAPLGILTINEAREIFNLAPVADGDKRLQTLNVVNADKADEYQTGSKTKKDPSGDDGEGAADENEE